MTQLEWHIIRNGLRINNIPPMLKERVYLGRPPSPEGATNMSTIISNVWSMEEALGIKVKGRYLHGKRLAGITPVRDE